MDRRKLEKEIVIGSFNIKNKKENRLDLKINGKAPSEIFIKHIESFDYDILASQEITKSFLKKIKLKSYEIVRFYRLGNFFPFPRTIDFNEANVIITKRQVIKRKVHHLPFFPSIPRIVIATLLKINGEEIFVLNTHLERKNAKVQEKQLKCLEKLVRFYSNTHLVILIGDFNMSIYNSNFKNFINNLDDVGLKRVEINEKTQMVRKNAIDHIFIPKDWEVIEKGLVNDDEMNQITDHYGIFARVKQN